MRASPVPEIPVAGAFDRGRGAICEKYQTKPNNPYRCCIFDFANEQFEPKITKNVVGASLVGRLRKHLQFDKTKPLYARRYSGFRLAARFDAREGRRGLPPAAESLKYYQMSK
jgi:hypothetical protein